MVSSSDPINHVLAAIASIRDLPDVHDAPPSEAAPSEEKPSEEKPPAPAVTESLVQPPAIIEPNGYSKAGPGPMAALRFKWTVRRADDGDYYVDETIGDNAATITAGPMSGDAAIKLVDDRESEAQRQFEMLKSEMTGPGKAANPVSKSGSEI